MDKNQLTQGAPDGVSTTRNRHLFWARFLLLAMLLTLGLTSLQPHSSAQAADPYPQKDAISLTKPSKTPAPNCPQQCEQAYVECLAGGGGATCDKQYDACIIGCQ